MKRIITALLCAALACIMCGCSGGIFGDADINVTIAPENTDGGAEQPDTAGEPDYGTDAASDMPVISDGDAIIERLAPGDYKYAPFTIEENGFYMEYPSHWERQPASRSVCFTEPVSGDLIPGRVVVTSKHVEEVGENTRENQLRSYFANILADFETYEWSDIYTSQPFMGDENALSVTYTAGKDEKLYKGYVIICAKGTTLYVYHFRCAETEYARMQPVMAHMRDIITISSK